MNAIENYAGKNVAAEPRAGTRNAGGKYLTFRLANEEYGLQILKVREINGIMDITAVPQMPDYMKGVINLRGKVIPVISLRSKFRLIEKEHTDQTCIIVVDVGREIGVIVDTVSEVLDISGENVDPPPALSRSVDSSFILGLGKVGEDIKILLDIDRILGDRELLEITNLANTPSEPGAA